jgi:carbazole 1,9a-dioxygenase terminal dioxygenase component
MTDAKRSPNSRFQAYLDAELGFRNHWYPALFSAMLGEGETKSLVILGERILFKRIDGRVYAIEDRCIHRGVPLSVDPVAHSKNTVSCWYHGFTYDVRSGSLVAVITDPECPMIGKAGVKSYTLEERKGLIFVFIGDEKPVDLALDLQPGFLDDDLAIYPRGEHAMVKSNWRLGAENGVDASHIYIHRNAGLVEAAKRALPLASYIVDKEGMVVDKEGAPKGVIKGSGKKVSVWETEIEGEKISSRYRPGEPGVAGQTTDTSLWLPCGLKVDPFPKPGITQFEWYVPSDEGSHLYIVTWGQRATSAAEAESFYAEMDGGLCDMVVNHFNNDDVVAREAMEVFYTQEDGWARERLFRPDLILVEWRRLASSHNRGIQKREQARAPSRPKVPADQTVGR